MKQVVSDNNRLNHAGPYRAMEERSLDCVQMETGSQCKVLGNRVVLSLWLYWEKTL